MAKLVKKKCPACNETKLFRRDNKTCGCQGTRPLLYTPKYAQERPQISKQDAVEIKLQELRDKKETKDEQINILSQRVIDLEAENRVFQSLENAEPDEIKIAQGFKSKGSESVAGLLLSDWHTEEKVIPAQVGGRNAHNLEVHKQRLSNLLTGALAWYGIESKKTTIVEWVVYILGDFITGSIHEDLAEGNLLAPADAIHLVYSEMIAFINALLAATPGDLHFTFVCHSGNHGRMTKEQRIATEAGNSLEYFMYLMLQDHYDKLGRVTFVVQPGYHAYTNLFDGAYVIRSHHGHQINYQGGVGGITIPVNKAIAQWNRARQANLDVFGHFHTRFDGGNFLANGSLIGYNAYAVSIKAAFEQPSQTFFLINREFNEKTAVCPIFVELPRG